MMHLAEINIARLKHDADDDRVADFMNALDLVNGIAERSKGFQWRHIDESGNATETRVMNDPRVIVNVSVWDGVEALETFVWGTVHRQFYQRREEWFNVLDSMHFAMWHVEPGSHPTVDEAMARLQHLNTHGDSDHAFGWSHLPAATRWRSARCSAVAAE
ncbi:DUF3291 domain-containing protein [Tritonibacter scottomollicae]|uniref:DUF3291 domain-containing protein n=1 Tax=Tritonibacter scottomollicae TaxID=483013 RepID=UPI003AA9335E